MFIAKQIIVWHLLKDNNLHSLNKQTVIKTHNIILYHVSAARVN